MFSKNQTFFVFNNIKQKTENSFVRNLRLIQPMVIILEGVEVNRVMVSFRKFKQVNAKDNYMQVYNNQLWTPHFVSMRFPFDGETRF